MKKRTDMAAGKRRGVRAIASSRLTSKSQATVPASVRKKLNLKPGDTVVFDEAEHGTIRLRKAEPLDIEFLSALESTLSEWKSENDERAYRDL
jgi:AbrB family looped-hinge helix DNA binding protein